MNFGEHKNRSESLFRKLFFIIGLFCTKSNIWTIKQKVGFIKRWNEWFRYSIFYSAFILFCTCSKSGIYFTHRWADHILQGFGVKVDGLESTSIGSGQSLTVNKDGDPWKCTVQEQSFYQSGRSLTYESGRS